VCQKIESELSELLRDRDLPGLAALFQELTVQRDRESHDGVSLLLIPGTTKKIPETDIPTQLPRQPRLMSQSTAAPSL
jgi:hypothetical protein